MFHFSGERLIYRCFFIPLLGAIFFLTLCYCDFRRYEAAAAGEVLRLTAAGHSHKAIANILQISVKSIET